MKKILCLTVVLLFLILPNIFSQDSQSQWAFELSTGKNEYRGDRTNGFFKNIDSYEGFGGAAINPGFVEIGVSKYLNRNFDALLQMSYGDYGVKISTSNFFKGYKSDISALIRYKLNNNWILPSNSFIVPFAEIGGGFANYSGNTIGKGNSVFLPIGVGFQVRLSSALSLQYQLIFNLNSDDKADVYPGMTPVYDKYGRERNLIDGKGDNFLKQTFGIVINFGNIGKSGSSYGRPDNSNSIFSIPRNLTRKLFSKN